MDTRRTIGKGKPGLVRLGEDSGAPSQNYIAFLADCKEKDKGKSDGILHLGEEAGNGQPAAEIKKLENAAQAV